jgi:hypothetical protein
VLSVFILRAQHGKSTGHVCSSKIDRDNVDVLIKYINIDTLSRQCTSVITSHHEDTLSRSRVGDNPIDSLADVISAVRAAELPECRKQDILAALHTLARALDMPPERVPADPRRLLPRLRQIAPRAIGLSPGRWKNVRSLTRAGIALLHPVPPVRSRQRLSDRWAALYGQLGSRWSKLKLSRFLRFCSSQGVEPAAVTESTFAAFRQHLDDKFLHDPDKIYAALVDGWRAAQTAVDSWPQLRITIPRRRNEWTFAWERFPASLQRECMAWCDRLAGRDLLGEAPFRPVKPTTVKRREWQIRGFATAWAGSEKHHLALRSNRDRIVQRGVALPDRARWWEAHHRDLRRGIVPENDGAAPSPD